MEKRNEIIVLVIDDDEMNLQIAKMILEKKLSCKVIAVDNGAEGIDVLRNNKIRLVLLDIMMPDFDGIETLQEIRSDENISDVPIMMLTASADLENVKKSRALGVTDYIRKPFMPADLVERVSKKLAETEPPEKILLVDENKWTLKIMCDVAEKNFPFEVETAATADDAIKILSREEISLLVTNGDIKFVNGLKLLNFISRNEELGELPFAITTPENLSDVLKKFSPQLKDDKSTSTPETEPTIIAEKKIANVVTNIIGYELT